MCRVHRGGSEVSWSTAQIPGITLVASTLTHWAILAALLRFLLEVVTTTQKLGFVSAGGRAQLSVFRLRSLIQLASGSLG